MTKIALLAMSCKPFHKGHDGIIRMASEECDQVHLYVSTADRRKTGEAPVYGSDMKKLWDLTIERTMPANVKVTYSVKSPIGDIWNELGTAIDEGSTDDFIIYSDPDDMATNFPLERLQKYCRPLLETGKVHLRPVNRTQTVDVSGTMMRRFLACGDRVAFKDHLPPDVDGDLIWHTLFTAARSAG